MNVSDAVTARSSTRAFSDKPVGGSLLRMLLEQASRSPSGGNLQPWHVHAIAGLRLRELLATVQQAGPDPAPGYEIYPEGLAEPYRTRRFASGEALYATLNIAREDKIARRQQFARNGIFFGAPAGLFISVDRQMGPPQWADLGMFIQTFLLLATEACIDTCAQEYWALHARTLEGFLSIPDRQMLFCGIALGYRDASAPINGLRTTRAPLDEWCQMIGFPD